MYKLIVEDISYSFENGIELLSYINLTVKKGELVVILGENGSGKSTLLKILAGIIKPSNGQVSIDGTTDSPKLSVGMVFQNPDEQILTDSVQNEIASGLEYRGVNRRDMTGTIKNSLHKFNLQAIQEKVVDSLSGGQKQKVALAAVLAVKPLFLLLDEPDSMLDAPSRKDFLSQIDELRKECGIIWVSPHPLKIPSADSYYFLTNKTLQKISLSELKTLV